MTPSSFSAPNMAELDSSIARIAREALVGVPERLREAMLYSLLGPGKRIRPRLVRAVGTALDLDPEVSDVLGTALEMTHAYTLVHDDLPAMDNDDFRRGRPTNHKVYGEGLAILAGDGLALLAPAVLVRLRGKIPAERILELVAALLDASGAPGVIAGQAAEMVHGGKALAGGKSALYEIFRLKTGALFRVALVLPAIAAGADRNTIAALGKLGDDLGIAFQIADDLEDDFAQKKSDPAHIAAYLDAAEARLEASNLLLFTGSLPKPIGVAIEPFIAELRRKIAGE
jgi:geranylgeranyl diphosphate synthase type II